MTPEANIHILPEAKSKKKLSKKKKKDKAEATINWSKQAKLNERIPCNLKAEVLHDSNEMSSPFDVFEKVMQLDKLVTLIATETNRYAQQNRRNFVTNGAEMKAFLVMNNIIKLNQQASNDSSLLGK